MEHVTHDPGHPGGTPALYGPIVPAALAYAATVHASQRRKGKDEAYLTHLLRATQLALRYSDPAWPERDHVVAAAAMHDLAEDHGGDRRLQEITAAFGPVAAGIVRQCSDSLVEDSHAKLPWAQRKADHLRKFDSLDPVGDRGFALVTTCDKISNLEDLLDDIEASGFAQATSRFKGGPLGTALYYRAMCRSVSAVAPEPAVAHLRRLVRRLLTIAGIEPESLDDTSMTPAQQFEHDLDAIPPGT